MSYKLYTLYVLYVLYQRKFKLKNYDLIENVIQVLFFSQIFQFSKIYKK